MTCVFLGSTDAARSCCSYFLAIRARVIKYVYVPKKCKLVTFVKVKNGCYLVIFATVWYRLKAGIYLTWLQTHNHTLIQGPLIVEE